MRFVQILCDVPLDDARRPLARGLPVVLARDVGALARARGLESALRAGVGLGAAVFSELAALPLAAYTTRIEEAVLSQCVQCI